MHVLKEVAETSVGLGGSWQNLTGGQDEAVVTGVAKLGRESVVSANNIINVIDAAAGRLVDGGANGAIGIVSAIDRLDGSDSALGKGLELSVLGRPSCAGVTVCYTGRQHQFYLNERSWEQETHGS